MRLAARRLHAVAPGRRKLEAKCEWLAALERLAAALGAVIVLRNRRGIAISC